MSLSRWRPPPPPAPPDPTAPWLRVLTNADLARPVLEYLASTPRQDSRPCDVVVLGFLVSYTLATAFEREAFALVVVPPILQALQTRALYQVGQVFGAQDGARPRRSCKFGLVHAFTKLHGKRNRTLRRTNNLAMMLNYSKRAGVGPGDTFGFTLPTTSSFRLRTYGPGVGLIPTNPSADASRMELDPADAEFVRIVCEARRSLGPSRDVERFGHVSEYAAPFRRLVSSPSASTYFAAGQPGRVRSYAWVLVQTNDYVVFLTCTLDEYMDLMSTVGRDAYVELEAPGRSLRMGHCLHRAFFVYDDAITEAWRTHELCGAGPDTLYHLFYHLMQIASCTGELRNTKLNWTLRDKGRNQAQTEAALTLRTFAHSDDALVPLGPAYRIGLQLRRIWRQNRSGADVRPTGTHHFFALVHLLGLNHSRAQNLLDLNWRWSDIRAFRRAWDVPTDALLSTAMQLRNTTADASYLSAEAEHLQAVQQIHDIIDMRHTYALLKNMCRVSATWPNEVGWYIQIDDDHVHPGYRARRAGAAQLRKKKRRTDKNKSGE